MILIIPETAIRADINRLTNQVWKLIPMKENNEDWKSQIQVVMTELIGLQEIYLVADDKMIILLSKLKGLLNNSMIEFSVYRKTVFECISLLRGMRL